MGITVPLNTASMVFFCFPHVGSTLDVSRAKGSEAETKLGKPLI